MADQPVPRSYQSILSDIIDTFLLKYKLKTLKVGGPILTILEAAAQSDLRSSQDFFNFLDSISLDYSTGQALLRIAASENIVPLKASRASDFVTFSDTSFSKISTSIYQGSTSPAIGTTALKVADASLFPISGKVYIGRNTTNYEGPIAYNTAPVNNGSYWTITLAAGTTKPHNLGESIILAQGGNRQIKAGTVIQTPQGGVSDPIKFSTLYSATILDGENFLSGVQVIAQVPGTIGNVPANTITEVSSSVFNGVAVTNPLPFTNGQDAETEEELKERIKDVRQSRQKATSLAIRTKIKGVTSNIDNKTVVSAQIINPQTSNPTLIIDDGTGYEETVDGVATETLVDSALGGEQYFQLSAQRPVAKAFIESSVSAPFQLSDGAQLAVTVGGVLSTHTFNTSDFKEIDNATAYEVVASINGDSSLTWSARTSNNANNVVIFAKSETNEDIQVVAPGSGVDANTALVFPTTKVFTLSLYTDKLLHKDGQEALISSNAQTSWASTIQNGDTLTISIDGTASQSVTINDSDFVSQNTGYNTVSVNNSLDAWATVLNSKIAGVTVTNTSGTLTIKSNLGASKRASISITGGTLVSKSMFNLGSTTGSDNDYTLNRNTGQIKLTSPLKAGDSLTAATKYTAAHIQSADISSGSITFSSDANLWLVVDGATTVLSTNVTGASSFTLTNPATNRVRYATSNNAFGSGTVAYVKAGDWMVLWDPNFTDKGSFRVANVDTTNWSWVEVERGTINLQSGITLSKNGMVFVRTDKQVETITITSGTYSLSALVSNLNSKLEGCTASVYKNTKVRITTNTLGSEGDLTLVAADTSAQLLQFKSGALNTNYNSHYAQVESGNPVVGTPGFKWTTVSTVPNATTFTGALAPTNIGLRSGDLIRFRKRLDSPTAKAYGQNANEVTTVSTINGSTITPATTVTSTERLVNDRYYSASPFGLVADDGLSLVLDNDSIKKNYNIQLTKNVKPDTGATYGSSTFNVVDSGTSQSLSKAFGTSFSFNDFAVYMKARGKSHSITNNKTILWRYGKYGPEGEKATIRYINPSAPSTGWSISTDTSTTSPLVNLILPSGTERTGLSIAGNDQFVISANTVYSGPSSTVSSVARSTNVVTVTLNGSYNTTDLAVGDIIYQTSSNDANFVKGPKKIASVTSNTFTYNETGTNATYSGNFSFTTSKLPAGRSFAVSGLSNSGTTITATTSATHNFNVGDTVYFLPGHYDATSGITVAAGAKTVVSVPSGTTLTWTEGTNPTATATLVSGINYSLSTGQAVKATVNYHKAQAATGNVSRSGSTVTVTVSATPLVNGHGFKVGDVVHLSPGEANFNTGPKLVASVPSTTQFTYIESGAAASSTGVQFFTLNSTDINLTGGTTPVVAGDVVHIDSASSLDSAILGDRRVNQVSSTQFSILLPDTSYAGNTTPAKLNGVKNLRFYPINTTLSTAAQAVSFANGGSIVSGALVYANGGTANNGSAVIDTATEEEFLLGTSNASIGGASSDSVGSWPLFDGLNWILNTTMATSTSGISLKNSVSGELTSNADFANEVLKLVPVTLKNITDYLNNVGSGGFYSSGTASMSDNYKNLQISSDTIGSAGAVQITGGTANTSTATVYGSGQAINDSNGVPKYGKILVPSTQINGFAGDLYVSLQGTSSSIKTSALDNTATMSITATADPNDYIVSFNKNVVTVNQVVHSSNLYQIERHGKFMAYIDISASPTSLASLNEGDWVYVVSSNLSVANTGTFQVVRIDDSSHTFWIENTKGVEEVAGLGASDYIKFISYDSAMPGDTLIIGTPVLGQSNVGSFTISKLSESGATTTATEFHVTGSLTAVSNVALGNNYPLIQIKENKPIRLIKKIYSIVPDTIFSGYYNVIFTTPGYIEKISPSSGAVMTALDKFNFSTDLKVGRDGYSYNSGLLSEVNKVVYGDETNPSVYPGELAAGANLSLSGPLVRRIAVSLLLRLRAGDPKEISNRVKNAVAALINASPVGESIAISDIVGVANAIDGVLSVVIISPTYSSGNDLIPVQSNEKPRVLNLDEDISISIVGD